MADREKKSSASADNLQDSSMYKEALNDAKNKNVQKLLNRLSSADQEKVRNILSSPEETQKILSNPKIQELIRKLNGSG